jgi:hypothetical protein
MSTPPVVATLEESPALLPGLRFWWMTGTVQTERVIVEKGESLREMVVRGEDGSQEVFRAPADVVPECVGHVVTVILASHVRWADADRVLGVRDHTEGADHVVKRAVERVNTDLTPMPLSCTGLILFAAVPAGVVAMLAGAGWGLQLALGGFVGSVIVAKLGNVRRRKETLLAHVRQISLTEAGRLEAQHAGGAGEEPPAPL